MIKRKSYSGLRWAIILILSRYSLIGFRLLLNIFFRIVFQGERHQYYLFNQKHFIIKKWLLKKYRNIIPHSISLANEINCTSTIWIFWWQGQEMMPPIVKACYNSVLKYSGEKKVVLVTKFNFNEYVEVPNQIIEKVENNVITLAHFSDILRVSLLYKYGGLWIDSTFFVTNSIPDRYFNSHFCSIKLNKRENWSVTRFRWSVFVIGAQKKSPIMRIMRDLLLEYNLREDKLIDYLLVDYFFDILIDMYPDFKKFIDESPYTNENLYVLSEKMNDEFTLSEYEDIIRDTMFFKLTYKHRYVFEDSNGKETFYSRIINDRIML